ncbi:hypothetical protein CMV_008241 [Castanea mollissima]|uniref:DUF1664 domain-containing protein n=1 Tax=Castanea mollissima TaxID=60419 RepID=A0A8J4RM23_9ROSI|nr:hypothetical protein CMV_008241 [Castanea mollissima]
MDVMDSTLDECAGITSETQQEVSELRKRTDFVGVDVLNIHDAVQTLETKISRIEGKQDLTNEGVRRLCHYARNLENSRTPESAQALPSSSSKLALEQPPTTPSSKVAPSSSYRPALELPPISPSSRVKRPLQNAVSAPGLQDISGISEVVEVSRNHEVSNGNQALEDPNGGASSYGRFGLRFPSISTSFLSRTRSATNAIKIYHWTLLVEKISGVTCGWPETPIKYRLCPYQIDGNRTGSLFGLKNGGCWRERVWQTKRGFQNLVYYFSVYFDPMIKIIVCYHWSQLDVNMYANC